MIQFVGWALPTKNARGLVGSAHPTLLFILAACLALAPQPGWAQPKFDIQVQVGFAGQYKVGAWTPVSVTITGPSTQGTLLLSAKDDDDVSTVVSRSVQVDGRPKQLFVRFGGAFSSLNVRFVSNDERTRLQKTFESSDENDPRYLPSAKLSSQELIVSLGPNVGLQRVIASQRAQDDQGMVLARLDGRDAIEQLPIRWFGYEGVDWLVIATSNGELFGGTSPDNARWEAIRQWVLNGGKLVIVGGGHASDLAALFRRLGPVGELIPGKLQEDKTLLGLGELVQYVGTDQPPRLPRLDQKDPNSRRGLEVPLLSGTDGAVEVSQEGVPLIVRAPRGFGEVIFIALDLDRPSFARWEHRREIWFKLLEKTAAPEQQEDDTRGEVVHAGVTDLAGQLKGALDQFAGISLVPFMLVALMALGYIILIGPVDYWLVKKVLGRPALTWVTFPVMVIAVSYAAYELAYWLKGDQIRLNQVDVVDVDLTSGHIRGQTWFNVFSPDSREYNVSVQPQWPSPAAETDDGSPEGFQTVVSWMGLPGSALGGMDREGAGGLFSGGYRFSANYDEMLGVPISVWSSKSFTARWIRQADASDELGLQLKLDGGGSTGTLTSTLKQPLRDCWLVYVYEDRTKVIEINQLAPDTPWSFDLAEPGTSLEQKIRRTQLRSGVGPGAARNRVRQWDHYSVDVADILRQMTFYYTPPPVSEEDRRPLGEKHTELLHRYLRHVDLSHLFNPRLNRRRALLMGFGQRPATTVDLGLDKPAGEDPRDKHWTLYRFVFDINEGP